MWRAGPVGLKLQRRWQLVTSCVLTWLHVNCVPNVGECSGKNAVCLRAHLPACWLFVPGKITPYPTPLPRSLPHPHPHFPSEALTYRPLSPHPLPVGISLCSKGRPTNDKREHEVERRRGQGDGRGKGSGGGGGQVMSSGD